MGRVSTEGLFFSALVHLVRFRGELAHHANPPRGEHGNEESEEDNEVNDVRVELVDKLECEL